MSSNLDLLFTAALFIAAAGFVLGAAMWISARMGRKPSGPAAMVMSLSLFVYLLGGVAGAAVRVELGDRATPTTKNVPADDTTEPVADATPRPEPSAVEPAAPTLAPTPTPTTPPPTVAPPTTPPPPPVAEPTAVAEPTTPPEPEPEPKAEAKKTEKKKKKKKKKVEEGSEGGEPVSDGDAAEAKPAEEKPAEEKPAEEKPAEEKPAEPKPDKKKKPPAEDETKLPTPDGEG